MINNKKWRKSSIKRRLKKMIFNIKWNESNEIKNIINDCLKTSWIMQQIWKMNLIKKWKYQKSANVSKNSHYYINQKNYLMNFIFIFVFIFKRAFDALFSNDRNRQIIHEWFCFIFIFNRYNDVSIIFRFDFFYFDFFIILIKMSIVFLKDLFSTLTCFVSKILNNFLFSISARSSRYFIIFVLFSNWIKRF